ncbi:MAG: aminoglycoside phosphotransferase family protein [Dehalococcoidia bacterium]|nr:aminoglycoside phosphotransferase family protein [Dehalococcoidia bacterium]
MTGEPDPACALASVGWEAVAGFHPVSGGWDTHLWRFETGDGRHHVLRMYRAGSSLAEYLAAIARNEVAALRGLAAAGIPVPAVEAEGELDGAPFTVQSWIEGEPLMDLIGRRPWQVLRLGERFGRLQARLHEVRPAGVVELDERQWLTKLRRPPLVEALRRAAVPDAFCHLDYHPMNVMIDGRKLTVLDFTNARMADRRLDLAKTRLLLLISPLPPSRLNPLLQVFRRLFARGWERGYRAEAGQFPLSPLFEAGATALHLLDVESAVRDGRGWATVADIHTIRRHYGLQLRAAGLA